MISEPLHAQHDGIAIRRRMIAAGVLLIAASIIFTWWAITPNPDKPGFNQVTPAVATEVGADKVADSNNIRTDWRTGRIAVHNPTSFEINVYEADGKKITGPFPGCLGVWYPDGQLGYRDKQGCEWKVSPETSKTVRVHRPLGAQEIRGNVIIVPGDYSDVIKIGGDCPVLGARRVMKIKAFRVDVKYPGYAETTITFEG